MNVRIWAASTIWRACRRESARHPSCGYRSREIHACEFADFVIANLANDNVFCHSLDLSKEVVSFTEIIYSVGKVRLHVLTGKYVKCSETVRQADVTCRTVYTTSSCSKPVRLAWEQQWGPRKMVPWSQMSSEDDREISRPHRINVTYRNGKRARIIRAAGNYA